MFDSRVSRPLISDELAVRDAVTAIRNSLLPPNERQPSSPEPGRRTYGRLVVEAPVFLVPVVIGDRRVTLLDGGPISARTRDLSLRSIGFVHTVPLTARYAAVGFSTGARNWVVVEVTRSWPTGKDSWFSGAKILGLIEAGEAATAVN